MPVTQGEWLRIAITAFLTWVLQRLWNRALQRRKQITDQQHWAARVDLETIQACLLTSVNINKCGRVEKRTVMTKKISDIFSNEYIRNVVLEAASKTTHENPFVVSFLPREDRWNVLVAAQNHLSSVFGPYHLFSNQVNNYDSCWYVFTLVGVRTKSPGRFFVTPQHPVTKGKVQDDVGTLRIRLVMIDEQEVRRICSGDINAGDMFSERHGERWNIMERFADIFEQQLTRVTRTSPGSFDIRTQSWGNNLCGTFKHTKVEHMSVDEQERILSEEKAEVLPSTTDCFLRIHVPVPLLKETKHLGPQDVVLYE
jgi:hypothetical protein